VLERLDIRHQQIVASAPWIRAASPHE